MTAPAAHSARLHAITAALCALLLLAALGLLAVHHAPWWALLGVQGALLVCVASAGIWLDRWVGAGRQVPEERDGIRGGVPFSVSGTARYFLPGMDGRVFRSGCARPQDDDDVFWHERMRTEEEET